MKVAVDVLVSPSLTVSVVVKYSELEQSDTGLRGCVKVAVDVLVSPSLTVSVEVEQH